MNIFNIMIDQIVTVVGDVNMIFSGVWDRFLRLMDHFVRFVREEDCPYHCYSGQEPIRNSSYVFKNMGCVVLGIEARTL